MILTGKNYVPDLSDESKRNIRNSIKDIKLTEDYIDKKRFKVQKQMQKKLLKIYSRLPKEWDYITKEILNGKEQLNL